MNTGIAIFSLALISLSASSNLLSSNELDERIMTPFTASFYKNCSSKAKGIMQQVDITPCSNPARCPLIRGTNATVAVDFVPTISANRVFGTLGGVLIPGWPAINFNSPMDLCTTGQIQCPIQAGQTYHYEITIPIKTSYPRIKLDTRVLITGDDETVICVLIPVEIKSQA